MIFRLNEKIRQFLGLPVNNVSSAVIAQQVMQSLRLQSVSIAGQLIGIIVILFCQWHTDYTGISIGWAVVTLLPMWQWLHFRRRFLADENKERNVRDWLRRLMIIATLSGVVWGFAGLAFLFVSNDANRLVTVAIIVAVVFASWPAFSCWLPSLTVMTLTSLAPLVISMAAAFDMGRWMIASILLVLTVFVLYSGRLFNEIVQFSVLREQQNEKLVLRLKAEKALAEAERQATEAASAQRARFFAGANHDLRQPLQAMGIYLQILQMQANDTNREVIEQLAATAGNISKLVEQILEVSHIEMGNMEVKIEPVRIQTLFEDLRREFEPVAVSKGLNFRVHDFDAVIETDPQLLMRVIGNLITNAIRYTRREGGTVTLGARAFQSGAVQIGVYDEGPGITEAERAKIFESFYRGSAAKSGEGGFGLGLSIVRGLARRLGIEVTVSSRVGHGSVFHLNVPLHKGDAPGQLPRQLTVPSDLDVRGVVGVLDDNTIVRDAVATMVRGWGATVIASSEADDKFIEAMIAAASEGRLSALITDYNLGEGRSTGLETIFHVAIGAGRDIPSVILTAVNEDEIRAAWRRLCFHPDIGSRPLPVLVQKPAGAQELASALRRAIAEHRPGALAQETQS